MVEPEVFVGRIVQGDPSGQGRFAEEVEEGAFRVAKDEVAFLAGVDDPSEPTFPEEVGFADGFEGQQAFFLHDPALGDVVERLGEEGRGQ